MAVVNPPVWLEAGTYTAEHDRLVTGLLVDRNYDGSGTLQSIDGGVVGPKDQLQVTAAGTMTVTVSSGVAVIPRATLTPPGVYLGFNNGPQGIVVPTQASNQRNDILCARVNDAEEGNVGDNWELFLVDGSGHAGTTPTDPDVPTNYVKLARINVKSAALNGGVDKITSAQVTDLRLFVTGHGGIRTIWNGVYPQSQPGRLVYDTAVGGGLKYGIGGGTWWTLMAEEVRAFRAAVYAAKSDYRDNTVQKSGSSADTWDPTPYDVGASGPLANQIAVDTGGFYSSAFKVTVGALGICDDDNISGHLSVQVRDGSTEVYAAAIGKGPSFYGRFWVSSENTFIASLPATYVKHQLNFRVMFRSHWTGSGGGGSATVRWQRIRLIVEPLVV